MGRTCTVEFDQPDYYMCKLCRTHIALLEDFKGIHSDDELWGVIFHKAVNVQVDEPAHHRQVGGNTVADSYCVKCGDKLGWKYIQVGRGQTNFQNENVKLDLKKLLRMFGNTFRDAVTLQPVPENP